MFGFNIGKDKGEKEINIFDVKAVDELIDKIKERLNRSLEEEIKDQIRKLKVEYKRDEQNAINTGITAKAEEKAKEWICPRIPAWVNSDMLTVLGFLSSFIIATGFIFGFSNRWYLILVIVGLILNWFGDSFDGSIARYRKKTRPNYGYYIDHVVDGLVVLILGLGLGLSGFFKIEIALAFVIMYLILMIHVELITYVQNEFKYSFGLVGPTEIRIIGILLTIVMFFLPVKYFDILGYTLTQYDFFASFAVVVMGMIILFSILSKAIELDKIDRKRWK
ncbi:CDP-alcohol phosphatidyltransferase family protein [Candidatus Dojkabacteria bacterium]|uniref:CDP-alcohol phosphatidyltransferase family protein n=1 Tax=Candidatus Dojkabacteria bacterium TaxID=2099670 RepID=A0A847EU97_9BACT|nr:CDP-alcohol phosphatidyltransferase family protein [Candidatus Dojkabacteria bacterium]HRX43835.1 CDP-alcohol phosphatidyltransferase family protein [Candidatus Dojkabacteria bacterium]